MAAAAAARRFKKLNFKPPVDVDAWDMEVLYMWWWWYWCTCYRASVLCLYYAHKMHSRVTFKRIPNVLLSKGAQPFKY